MLRRILPADPYLDIFAFHLYTVGTAICDDWTGAVPHAAGIDTDWNWIVSREARDLQKRELTDAGCRESGGWTAEAVHLMMQPMTLGAPSKRLR